MSPDYRDQVPALPRDPETLQAAFPWHHISLNHQINVLIRVGKSPGQSLHIVNVLALRAGR